MAPEQNPLPYTDTKPVGAADFYFAINATFRFILRRLGIEGLRRYWRGMGENYYQPVSERWKLGGIPAVAEYWKTFFDAEPGADVAVVTRDEEVRLEVRTCPAIKHLRDHGREIVPCFCQHCHFVSDTMAVPAGLTVRIKGGNGSCVQRFIKQETNPAPQNLEDIVEAS